VATDLTPNADRFSGFAELYDRVRPTPPDDLAAAICAYTGGSRPALVVDLGSGTGLSTRWCARWADRVVGVEPSDDMRRVAASIGDDPRIDYRPGWSHATGLAAGSADVVLAAQALHWMDPDATFAEVARVLRPGGMFVALDCDWPPSVGDAVAEQAWARCRGRVKVFEERLAAGVTGADLAAPITPTDDATLPTHFARDANKGRTMAVGVQAWSKDEHLERMRSSGVFAWCRELAFHATETGDAQRYIDLLRSQGDLQTLVKHGVSEETMGVTEFATAVRSALGAAQRRFWFTYRARLATTPAAS
jgi:SAM-dependent methyltransferase